MRAWLFACGAALLGCQSSSAPSRGGEAATPVSAPAEQEPAEGAARVEAPRAEGSFAPQADGSRADGAACSTGGECASGICEGEGCEPDRGRCAAKTRECTRDLRFYCGCDGKTFDSSGSCPGRTFSHRGKCGAPPG